VEELNTLVEQAQVGDLGAYSALVRRFQDMAVGYAHALLGDFHLAEDAAQEAFIQAYLDLSRLKEPAAFPGWFRRIVFKHCDRITRRKRVPVVALEAVGEMDSGMLALEEYEEIIREAEDDHLLSLGLGWAISGTGPDLTTDILEKRMRLLLREQKTRYRMIIEGIELLQQRRSSPWLRRQLRARYTLDEN